VNFAGLRSLPIEPLIHSTWYRAVPPPFASAPVPPHGFTRTVVTRFNAGDCQASHHRFDVLYLAEDPLTSLFEFGALLGTPLRSSWSIGNPGRPARVVQFTISSQRVVDLTDPAVSEPILGTTAQELTGDWEGYRRRGRAPNTMLPVGIAPTQQLGRALYTVHADDLVDGFIVFSARVPTRRVLILFDPVDKDGRPRVGIDSYKEVDMEQVSRREPLDQPRGLHD
jgi:RES domain